MGPAGPVSGIWVKFSGRVLSLNQIEPHSVKRSTSERNPIIILDFSSRQIYGMESKDDDDNQYFCI